MVDQEPKRWLYWRDEAKEERIAEKVIHIMKKPKRKMLDGRKRGETGSPPCGEKKQQQRGD